MHGDELVAWGLLAGVGAMLIGAYRLRVPYPILLVVGSAAIGLLGVGPEVELDPDVVLVLALPPLLYSAAFFTDLREARRNAHSIGMLAIGLVLFTTLVVGVAAHALFDLPWAVAFTLGAVVSPTDPVAATAIAGRLGAPRRYVTIVEGESLVNDATALIAYRFAVVAVLTGSFSLASAIGELIVDAGAGIAIGLATGFVVAEIRRHIEDPPTEITISLLTPFLAYLPAEAAGVSAVLAAVTAGVYLGWLAPQLISPQTRIQAYAFWEIIVFVLNCALFVLVGLELPVIIDAVNVGDSLATLVGEGLVVAAVVVIARFAWVYATARVGGLTRGPLCPIDPRERRRELFLIAWTGMRGAVSLAAALAIPRTIDSGAPFPQRDRVILLAFVVILVTLLVQGLSLPWLIERLGLGGDTDERREASARRRAAEAALARIEELLEQGSAREGPAAYVRGQYEWRMRRYDARISGEADEGLAEQTLAFRQLRREALQAERDEIHRLYEAGEIPADTLRKLERELDLEDSRLDAVGAVPALT